MPDAVTEGLGRTVPEGLLELGLHPERITARKLWRGLSPDQREAVVQAVMDDPEHAPLAGFVRKRVAQDRSFREKTVRGWPAAKVAHHSRLLDLGSAEAVSDALRAFHLAHRRDLMAEFLDAAGLEHERGELTDAALETLQTDGAPLRDVLEAAADGLLRRYPQEQVLLYLLTLRCFQSTLVEELDPWFRARATDATGGRTSGDGARAGTAHLTPRREAEGPEEGEDGEPERSVGFTTLDRQLIRAAVDAVQEIEGALDEDELDDLVSEVLELNGSRHRSYFHIGFVDSLLRRDPRAADLPAENRHRKAWYWAGYLSGLGRRCERTAITELHDRDEAVGELWGTAQASPLVAGILFDAFAHEGRSSEAARNLDPGLVASARPLLWRLAEEGQRLLRADRADQAGAIYDRLGEAVDRLREEGYDVGARPFLAIRRRRAHCYRQLGQRAKASELLHRLLEEERDPDLRAMVLTDLGLIDGGFRSLADLKVPGDRESRAEMKEALERGRDRFEEALDLASQFSGHGAYALGLLELLESALGDGARWVRAAEHLERATALFESEPERYRHGGVLARARLCLGAALLHTLDEARSLRAGRLVREGLDAGGTLPTDLVGGVIDHALTIATDRGLGVAEAFVRAQGPEVLDEVGVELPFEHSEALTTALLEGARDPSRSPEARAAALRRVVPALLRQERTGEAGQALDELEALAQGEVAREEYLAFISSPENHVPAWEAEDARWSRIQVLEGAGEYERAAAELEKAFHQVLARSDYGAQDDAETLLSKMREYPEAVHDRLRPLESRLENWKEERGVEDDVEAAVPDGRGHAVSVLFVGGDERQEKDQEAVRELVRERDPEVRVRFIHPGWSGNWAPHLEEVKRELPRHHAVVLMRFMRTELGRSIRREANIPWRSCYGAGRTRMARSILLAAGMGREREAG